MSKSIQERSGDELRSESVGAEHRQGKPVKERPRQIIGRFVESGNGNGQAADSAAAEQRQTATIEPRKPVVALEPLPVAVFCHEPPDSYIGGHVAGIVPALARRGVDVHLFCRYSFVITEPRVKVHTISYEPAAGTDVVEQAQEFNRLASNAFLQQFPSSQPASVIGYEWSSAPVLSLLKGLRNLQGILSLHSIERQRSDATSEIGRKIAEIERDGIENARALLVHDPATAEAVRLWLPDCADRTVPARQLFNVANFESNIDPGAIKARYQVGPVDPMILYVGDLDERYGPDLLLKAMPAILRHHPQARLVIVGDGQLLWPLRVYARYLLLEHAVRLVGSVTDQPMHELVQAADLIAVPSRDSTPWWPILAGWAARRPVVATHQSAKSLLEHEKDAVLIYPSENSIVWGVERVLYDPVLSKSIGEAGREKLQMRFGWPALAEQVSELLGVPARP
jgi:glycogen(starch) synthase